jgi:UDP-N-acetyl-D-mannosaminuronic acid transferase (WecB/TagA/CpsF family)
MESIEITSLSLGDIRLDFPSEKQLAALISAWDDDYNHQVCFLGAGQFAAASKVSEYGSMIASCDLLLPSSLSLASRARAACGDSGANRRAIPVASKRQEYLSYFEPLDDEEDPFHPYQALGTLSIFLSALEQRRGSVFLIGGNLKSIQRAEKNVRSTFPALRVVGRSPGDYGEQEEAALMQALQKAGPDIIVVGSSVKDGELWIPRHMRHTKSGIFLYDATIIEVLAG